ncbi:MAG: hypothetical protein E7312_05095 [Clostridiales bacterium]|nr:hypothetical protein [Clostridiales bacterium]
MMDLKSLSEDELSEIYVMAVDLIWRFSLESAKNSPRTDEKVRKYALKNYAQRVPIDLNEIKDGKFVKFLFECKELHNRAIEDRNALIRNAFSVFDEETKSVFESFMFEAENWRVKFTDEENYTWIEVYDSNSYVKYLLLKDAHGIPTLNEDNTITFTEMFRADDGRFVINGLSENYVDDTKETVSMSFTWAKSHVTLYSAMCALLFSWQDSPFEDIRSVCMEIRFKSEMSDSKYLNEKEKSLLPLITEITNISNWHFAFEGGENSKHHSYGLLKSRALELGYHKIVKLLTKMETTAPTSFAFRRNVDQVSLLLSNKKYEPLLRGIYNELTESQSEYPERVCENADAGTLKSIKGRITKLMHENGYSGKYPEYTKYSQIKAPRLLTSYGQSYVIANEKRVQSIVRFSMEDTVESDSVILSARCSGAALKKDETPDDLFGMSFDAKGKRWTSSISKEISLKESYNEDLTLTVSAAIKKAQMSKLTKRERELNVKQYSKWRLFLYIFVFAGGFFGIFFTICFSLLMFLLIWLMDGWQMALEVFTGFPWLFTLAFCWIAFGGAMGVVMCLAARK